MLAVVAAAGVALAAGLGALVARAALAPVRRFTRRTEEIAGNPDPVERIAVEGDDELARLARSFNATLDALERSVEAQRHLVADASHELRTPIASLRANIQTLEDSDRLPEHERAALRADILAELDELTALVGDVVELARGSKPAGVLDDVRVDRIVAALVSARAGARRRPTSRFRAELEPTLVRGEPRPRQPRRLQPARQRDQVEPAGRRRRDQPARRHAHRPRPRPRASATPTCRTSSSASTAPTARAACPAPASAWRSCARPPRRTAAAWRRRTPRAAAR